MTDRLKHYLEALGLFIAAALLWWHFLPDHAPVGQPKLAKAAPELNGEQKQPITPPKVQAFAPPAKRKLGLPQDIQDDPNKYVLGSTRLPNDTHPHTITTIIDSKTGEVQTYDRRDPLPWLAAERCGFLQLGMGMKTSVGKVWRAAGGLDVIQTGMLHLGLDGAIDTDGQGYAGVHFRVEF